MNIKLVNKGQEGILILEGVLDSTTSPKIEGVCLQTAERFDKLVLDLGDVQYLTSAALRVIKKLYMIMVQKGGSLVMKNVNENIMDVFEMTKLVGYLKFE